MKFKTRKKANKITLLIILILSLLSTSGTVICLIKLAAGGAPSLIPLLAGSLFFLLISFLLFIQSYAWYTFYEIKNGFLYLRGVYEKGKVPLESIREVKKADIRLAESVISVYLQKASECEKSGDLKGWYRNNKKYSLITRYCTVQIVQSYAGGRSHFSQKYTGSIIGSELVLISLSDGQDYLLSPDNPDDFIKVLSEYID